MFNVRIYFTQWLFSLNQIKIIKFKILIIITKKWDTQRERVLLNDDDAVKREKGFIYAHT